MSGILVGNGGGARLDGLLVAVLAANVDFTNQAVSVGAELTAALQTWGRLIDACADGEPPAADERVAAMLGIRAAQESIRALADALEPLALRYDTICGLAAGETAQ